MKKGLDFNYNEMANDIMALIIFPIIVLGGLIGLIGTCVGWW